MRTDSKFDYNDANFLIIYAKMRRVNRDLPFRAYPTAQKIQNLQVAEKMVRCKEAKKSRARSVLRIHKRSGFFR
jgi:hypothetical protein